MVSALNAFSVRGVIGSRVLELAGSLRGRLGLAVLRTLDNGHTSATILLDVDALEMLGARSLALALELRQIAGQLPPTVPATGRAELTDAGRMLLDAPEGSPLALELELAGDNRGQLAARAPLTGAERLTVERHADPELWHLVTFRDEDGSWYWMGGAWSSDQDRGARYVRSGDAWAIADRLERIRQRLEADRGDPAPRGPLHVVELRRGDPVARKVPRPGPATAAASDG